MNTSPVYAPSFRSKVKWLSIRKILTRLTPLRKKINFFFKQQHCQKFQEQLSEDDWVAKVVFLADIIRW